MTKHFCDKCMLEIKKFTDLYTLEIRGHGKCDIPPYTIQICPSCVVKIQGEKVN